MTLASKRLIWLSAAAFFSVLLFTTDCCELAADETEQQHSRTRVQWTTSRLVGSPDPPPPFQAERIWPDLTFQSPISFAEAPSLGLHLVLERRGVIKAFASSGDPKDAFVMLDLWSHVQETEQAKIAAARDFVLDPNFESNGFLYIVWSIQPHFVDGGTRISRFEVTKENPPRIDPKTRIDLLTYPSGDHIGACLRFGPDGMLYICTGDGAPPFPPDKLKTAQNLKDVRGSVLRIDVRGATNEEPYVIPDDNPFLQHPNARGEIFAFGIRNGFRAAFHPTTERLWVADVGWERCELVHQISKGGNHGWSLFEGPYAVEPDQPSGPGRPILPVIVMERDRAQSITGGMFLPKTSSLVREDPSLTHQYVFGCYMNGTVWAADVSNPENPQLTVAAKTSLRLIDFKLANVNDTPKGHKDLLMVDFGGGGIYRLVPNQQAQTSAFPRLLSQTGLYDDLNTLRPSPGVIAYQPKATMYRGGAKGSRVIGIPGSEPIDRAYPNGTVLANTISREVVTNSGEVKPKKLETQILLLDGLDWKPYTYRWNDEETDASLVEAKGDRIPIRVPDAILGQRTTEH
ncbi:MAG: PQQ-dependent sugar dehydrogenase, partial [Planctomycetota bacterium]